MHYTINGAGQQNFLMPLNSATGRFEKTVTALSAGQVINYWFTYSVTGATTADTGRFSFTVGGGTVATPTFMPGPGTYNSTQTVSISTATAGATIKFTVDGSTPTAASPTYTGPISVPATRTLKALATKTGMANSAVATGAYTIVTARYRTQDLVFTLGGLGTFTGRVVGDQFRFTGGNRGGTFFINGKPSTSMVLLGNGFLADPAGASDVGTQLLNRHVVEQRANWHNAAAFYPPGQPANWFAKFWHDHSIDNLAYGFAYDDVGGFSPSLYTDSPTVVTFTIGW